jgi:hypothetical protein
MAIKNYTTTVSEEKTVGEIMGLLAAKGARQILIDYDDQQRPKGVQFIVNIKNGAEDIGVPVPFKLPCNFEGVFKALASRYKSWHDQNRFKNNPESKAQARRVAWRIIKDWIDSQMALIEAEQATLAQVFLPYAVRNDGVTMFDQFMLQVSQQKALQAPQEVTTS